MNYFPLYIDLEQRDVLIVGGGIVAARKAAKLLSYSPRLSVLARSFCPELLKLPGLRLIPGSFSLDMLTGRDMVIAATDDQQLNRSISAACAELKIPVNVVDDRQACSFIFPALIKRGKVSIGISTGGASPSAAIYLREAIESLLPESLEDICAYLERLRPCIKAGFSSEQKRALVFKALFARCLDLGRALTDCELEDFLHEQRDG